jgi:hypothetical protein
VERVELAVSGLGLASFLPRKERGRGAPADEERWRCNCGFFSRTGCHMTRSIIDVWDMDPHVTEPTSEGSMLEDHFSTPATSGESSNMELPRAKRV